MAVAGASGARVTDGTPMPLSKVNNRPGQGKR